MATEKRLIDANDLWSDIMMLPHNGDIISSEEVEQAIKEAQTVDAVEVVRCKDCKHGMKSHLQPRHAKNYLCRHSWEGEYHEPNHFCSYGERKGNDNRT